MGTGSAKELWESCLGSLQMEVTRHNYDTWLRNTVGLEWQDSALTVGVPNAFVAECLEKRLAPLIKKTVSGVAQRSVEVQYQVHQAGTMAAPELIGQGSPEPAAQPKPRVVLHRSPLNPRYTFSSFVVGKSNRFAHAAAMAVAENPGQSYNPLFIHAGVGLGKTHLIHAIGHTIREKNLEFLYVSAEQFTNDFVSALRDNKAEAFRNKYRTIDVLLIDDIQFIAGKDHSRESFFHTFNDLHAANKQIVITADSRPKSIPLVEERLTSRFEGGLIADIQAPELETRLAILDVKAAQAGLRLGADVANFIARKVLRNVRELEGALNRLLAAARLTNRPIDMELAQQAIADIPSSSPRRTHFVPPAVLQAVAAFYGISLEALTSPSRKKEIVRARQVTAYLLREETSHSLADIGKLLGERGHTTVLRSHAKVAADLNVNSTLRHEIAEIRTTLEERHLESA